jgi:hypothetical protein
VVTLKFKNSTEISVEVGKVDIVGGCVVLYEYFERADNARSHLVFAYALVPGEIVRRIGKEEYSVEF